MKRVRASRVPATALFTLIGIAIGGALKCAAAEEQEALIERNLTPQVALSTRYSSPIEIPRTDRAPLHARVALQSWRLTSRDKKIDVPPQDFYVAELVNGSVETDIDGRVEKRRAGDHWAVQRGEHMGVRITGRRQENALLQIFTLNVADH